jgi:hypothetical protein
MHRGFSTALTTTLVAGVIVLAGVVGYLEYENSQPAPNSPATTTNATSSSSQVQLPDSWNTYKSEEYSFSFSYPGAYSKLSGRTKDDGPVGYGPRTRRYYGGRSKATTSSWDITKKVSKSSQKESYPTISLHIFNLQDYFYRDGSAGVNFEYDINTDSWYTTSPAGENKVEFNDIETVRVGSKTGYKIGSGEGGHSYEGVAIPYPKKNVMVEIGFTLKPSSEKSIDRGKVFKSFQFSTGKVESDESANSEDDQVSDSWTTYQNTAYGFSFQHPSNRTAFSEVDAKNRELTAASPRVRKVSIAQDESAVFCCEPFLLTFTIKETSELDISKTANFEQTTINGYPALLIKGDGGLGDVFKKIYLQLSESQWLVVNQNAESEMLNKILSTLKISSNVEVPSLSELINSQTTNNQYDGKENTPKGEKDQVPDLWKAYENNKWGFALQYPQDIYGNFQVENQYSYGNPWAARVTAKKYPAIKVSAHRLDEYEFAEPNGQIYSYQLDNKNSWIAQIGPEEAYEPPTVSTQSGSAYKFERGVIGETADVYAIPGKDKNVMFTIKFIHNTIQDSDYYTTQTVDQKAIVSSFMSRANGRVIEDTLSTKGIKDQYKDRLAEKIAKQRNKSLIGVSETKPMDFVRWDYDNDGKESIAVVNIKSSTDPERDLVQEVIIFDIDNQNQLSNPQVVWEQSSFVGSDVYWDKLSLSTTTHNGRAVLKNTKQFSDETAKENHFIHYRNGSFYDAYSLAEVDKQTFLSDINKQYTKKLLSDPAFIEEASSSKGDQKHKVTTENRNPMDFVRWDHDDDGEKSLAVMNNAGGIPELILFEIDDSNNISNPRRINAKGAGSWVSDSEDLAVVHTYQGKFLRSKIWLGNSAPHMNYYSFQDEGFNPRGRDIAETDSECEVGFVYPKEDSVLNQSKTYEVRWKDLFNNVSRTRINPAVSRRNIKIINENEEVIGKLKTRYGLGQAAEWDSLKVINLDGDSLTDEGRLVEPGKYKLRTDYYYSQKARDRLQNNGCDLSDKKANDTHYENIFESEWFTVTE